MTPLELARRGRDLGSRRRTAELARWSPPPGRRGRSGLAGRCYVLPPAAAGSLGDEAVVSALVSGAGEAGWSAAAIQPGRTPWLGLDGARVVLPRLFGWAPGRETGAWLAGLVPGDRVLLFGADVLDGAYSRPHRDRLVALGLAAAAAGAQVDVVSFSLVPGGDTTPALGRLMTGAGRVVARDALTQRLCAERFGRVAGLAPDAAFLHPPSSDATPARAGHVVVNSSTMSERAFGAPGVLSSELAGALLAAGATVRTVVHDHRAGVGDREAMQRLRTSCSTAGVVAQPLAGGRLAPQELRALLAGSELVVTGRLHLAIAAISSGVPVVGLAYSAKWPGLWELLGLPEETLIASGPGVGRRIGAAIELVRAGGDPLRREVLASARWAQLAARQHLPEPWGAVG